MKIDRLNAALRVGRKHLKVASKRRKLRQILKDRRDLLKPVDKDSEVKHLKYWFPVYSFVSPLYFRYYSNFSGNIHYQYVPDDLFAGVIERAMNSLNFSSDLNHKSILEKFIGTEYCPVTYLRNLSGVLMDREFKPIARKSASQIFDTLREDLIVKPSTRSGGGKNIRKLKYDGGGYVDMLNHRINFENILELYGNDFVIQKVIDQHEELARFNPSSVNTLRVYSYRNSQTEEVHILNTRLLFGGPKSWVSNAFAGGFQILVDPKSGDLKGFAISKKFDKYYEHPVNGLPFGQFSIPSFHNILDMIRSVAARMPGFRFIAFDTTVDQGGNPIVIETNLKNIGITQRFGFPIFGEFSDLLIEDVLRLKSKDTYEIVRYR